LPGTTSTASSPSQILLPSTMQRFNVCHTRHTTK
jgi:hypothetical protein